MRHQRTLACALTLLALVALTQPAPRPAQVVGARANDALGETLRRLGDILSRHGSRAAGGTVATFDVRDFRGCRITYELTPRAAPDRQGPVPFIERVTVDLSALDPERVTLREGRRGTASLSFATRDGERGIESRLASSPHQFGAASRYQSHHISLRSKAAAEEARALLMRAIEQCRP